MPQLIKDRMIVADDWIVVRSANDIAALAIDTPVILPLPLWQTQRATLSERYRVGVWLSPSDDPAAVVADFDSVALIAIDFPQFTDGRGYSTARLLREKYGYRGELRAIGDVLRDQLYYLQQCGFNAFAVRPDRNIVDALAGLSDFDDSYQATVARPVPLFRRRFDAATASAATDAHIL
jgi:uncharacterized protein (DUF934 family)